MSFECVGVKNVLRRSANPVLPLDMVSEILTITARHKLDGW